jgi:hypothetical protein
MNVGTFSLWMSGFVAGIAISALIAAIFLGFAERRHKKIEQVNRFIERMR